MINTFNRIKYKFYVLMPMSVRVKKHVASNMNGEGVKLGEIKV